eukprot:2933080-Amphidinium_carterae.1
MQKRVFIIAAQSTPRELGIPVVIEIIKKHGKRLTASWDFAAYRADVASSSRHGDMVEPMRNRCATRIGDDQMGLQHPIIGMNATGRSAPMMGRSKHSHAKFCREDHYMDPTTSRHEGHDVEPARTVTTEWDTPYPIIGL